MLRQTVVWACALLGLCGATAWAEEKKTPDYSPIELLLPEALAVRAKMRTALAEITDFDFKQQPLSKAIELLAKRHKLVVETDRRSLEDAQIDPEMPITRSASGISLSSGLQLILGPLDLEAVPRGEILVVAHNSTHCFGETTIVYPVGDLATPGSAVVGGEDFAPLVAAIKTSAAPTTWDEVGGPGTIALVPQARAIVIRNIPEAHAEIERLLAALREARDRQAPAPRVTSTGVVLHALTRALQSSKPRAGSPVAGENRNEALPSP